MLRFTILLVGSVIALQPIQAATDETVAASDVGEAVQNALLVANAAALPGGLKLRSAKLVLEVGRKVGDQFDVNFVIFTISHKDAKQVTAITTMQFGEPPKAATGSKPPIANIKDDLARSIAAMIAAATPVTGLPFTQGTIHFDFAVDRTNQGGLSFTIFGIKAGGNLNLENTSKNSLEVTFSTPAPMPRASNQH